VTRLNICVKEIESFADLSEFNCGEESMDRFIHSEKGLLKLWRSGFIQFGQNRKNRQYNDKIYVKIVNVMTNLPIET